MKPESRKPFGTSMLPSLHDRVVELCERKGVRVWAFIERAAIRELDKMEKEEYL